MPSYAEPTPLIPEDRFQAIAALLAVGLRRLHAHSQHEPLFLENRSESSLNCLEFRSETVLSGPTG
jgi:hypothetical protein